MGEFPGEPTDGDALDPDRETGRPRAAGINAVLAMTEGANDAAGRNVADDPCAQPHERLIAASAGRGNGEIKPGRRARDSGCAAGSIDRIGRFLLSASNRGDAAHIYDPEYPD